MTPSHYTLFAYRVPLNGEDPTVVNVPELLLSGNRPLKLTSDAAAAALTQRVRELRAAGQLPSENETRLVVARFDDAKRVWRFGQPTFEGELSLP